MNFFIPVATLPGKYLGMAFTRRHQGGPGPGLPVSSIMSAGTLAFTAPVIIESGRPDSAEIDADLVGTRRRGMTTTPALTRPRRRPFMNDIPINTIFTIG